MPHFFAIGAATIVGSATAFYLCGKYYQKRTSSFVLNIHHFDYFVNILPRILSKWIYRIKLTPKVEAARIYINEMHFPTILFS